MHRFSSLKSCDGLMMKCGHFYYEICVQVIAGAISGQEIFACISHAVHPPPLQTTMTTTSSDPQKQTDKWVEERLTPCSLCGALHSAASRRSDTEDPLCHYYHAAWSRETLFQNGGLIFSRTIREWLKNRHQTGLIKNRRRLQKL